MKTCKKCNEKLELTFFPNHKKKKDGKGSWCKPCVSKNTQKYISKNKESHKQKMEIWREKNPQYSSQWNFKNQNYHNEYYKNKILKDEFKVLTKGIRSLIYDSFKRGCNNTFQKDTSTEDILGCSVSEFISYIQSQFKEGMTIGNHGEWHLDHIYPVSLARDKDHLLELNHYTNFQPLWAKDNLKKSNKLQ
jgi:hypothetical protein